MFKSKEISKKEYEILVKRISAGQHEMSSEAGLYGRPTSLYLECTGKTGTKTSACKFTTTHLGYGKQLTYYKKIVVR